MRQTIGVDISKDHLDVHSLPDDKYTQLANTTLGHKRFSKWLIGKDLNLIVFEPTGAYHKIFQRTMYNQGFPINKVNPLHARRFAQATGVLTKTDKVDAAMLARMGTALDLQPQEIVAEDIQVLGELYMARRALMKDRNAALNRQKWLSHSLLKSQCVARLRQIALQVAKIDAEVKRLIGMADHHKQRFDILVSIPGISTITAISLIIEMPELGDLSSAQAASLAGLAPMHRESGKWKGKSFIQGGRATLRQSLYMPALVATRYNPDMRIVYDRLVGSGKPAKVAITAVMRKMIVLANALIKADRKWEPRLS